MVCNRSMEPVRVGFKAAHRRRVLDDSEWPEADKRAQKDAVRLVDCLQSPEYSTQQIKVFSSTPLLLTLLCLVVLRGGEIPKRRERFYRKCLEILLGRWDTVRDLSPPLAVEDALDLLRPLAFELHKAGRQYDLTAAEFTRLTQERLDAIRRRDRHAPSPDEVLQWLVCRSGVLSRYTSDGLGFAHLAFQEYLTAAHAAVSGEQALDHLADCFGDPWWREATLLLVGMPNYEVFAPLLRALIRKDAWVDEAKWALLGACFDEAHQPDAEPLLERFRDPETTSQQRAVILRILGGRGYSEVAEWMARQEQKQSAARLSEGHHRVHRVAMTVASEAITDPTTGIRFLPIPGGRFKMGDNDGPERESPAHWVHISPFHLAETQTTNEQYAVFLRATQHPEPTYPTRTGSISTS